MVGPDPTISAPEASGHAILGAIPRMTRMNDLESNR